MNPLTTLTIAEIERRFTYHRPEGDKIKGHEDIREHFKSFAAYVNAIAPGSREAEIGFEKLEEAANWFHAAIARPPVEEIKRSGVCICSAPEDHYVHYQGDPVGSFPVPNGLAVRSHRFQPG